MCGGKAALHAVQLSPAHWLYTAQASLVGWSMECQDVLIKGWFGRSGRADVQSSCAGARGGGEERWRQGGKQDEERGSREVRAKAAGASNSIVRPMSRAAELEQE